ncbi:MAG: heme exporter protein CcmD [Thermaurantiacus sp.]
MDHTPFIIAAYAVTFSAVGGMLVASFAWMRRAERERDSQ